MNRVKLLALCYQNACHFGQLPPPIQPKASALTMHDDEGFIHNGRRAFALRYTLESEPTTNRELIVPLGLDSNSTGSVRPAELGRLMVTVTLP